MIISSVMGFIILLVHGTFFRYLLYKNFIFVSLILPVMVLLVTKVIATNLYLSLGMIGALSIVRYRTPVKSQYELALYFSFICIGIIIGVNLSYAVYAFIFLSSIPLIYKLIISIFKRFNWYEPLNTSSENTSMNILIDNYEVEKILGEKIVIKSLKDFDQNNDLNQSSLNLVFDNFNESLELKKYLNNKYKLKSITINSN
ncbi:DUF4956 domain-containing protein [Candidatus Pelagibacter sp.]|nr:DUF4956 domain-containing protein [Candidatus Pelagibacter sp.]